jgi:hypothetical protein
VVAEREQPAELHPKKSHRLARDAQAHPQRSGAGDGE